MNLAEFNPDFEALVQQALDGNPIPLQVAMTRLVQKIRIMERRDMTEADYPACVRDLLHRFALAEVAQPNGMPKNGRPRKDPEIERLRHAYKAWAHHLARRQYEDSRLLYQVGKESGGWEIIDGQNYPIDGKPSDLAVQDVAEQFAVSDGAAFDLVFPDRRKKHTTD